MKKNLAIGIDDFKKLIEENYYYVDKTLLIKELLDHMAEVTLFTRPRRFGKTLIQSMLRYYFEKTENNQKQIVDNHALFTGMKIMEAGEIYTKRIGSTPVINITLKSAKQSNFEMAYLSIAEDIAAEYERHSYVLQTDEILQSDKEKFRNIMERKASEIDYAKSLKFLCKCLYKYYNAKVIVLIDEYDVPLENAYFAGFYDSMVVFIRSLFESVLKTNEYLDFAVVTGCLRISKESIFTGLNNLKVVSILDKTYGEYFGFTKEETDKILEDYKLTIEKAEVRHWYDGYLFGESKIYNPWSIINYVDKAKENPKALPESYWSNTSSNSIVKDLIDHADYMVKDELEKLIDGGTIEKLIQEDITYENVHESQDNLWNFLFFTGYLTKVRQYRIDDEDYLSMKIPNKEVQLIYKNTIRKWFDVKVKHTNFKQLYQAILEKDVDTFNDIIAEQMLESISFYDYAENYYHGFMAGLLQGFPDYRILSNRESGIGRADLVLKPGTIRKPVVIMEFKIVGNAKEMDAKCIEALWQIEEQNYQAEYEADGYSEFVKYGICFYKKDCCVKVAK